MEGAIVTSIKKQQAENARLNTKYAAAGVETGVLKRGLEKRVKAAGETGISWVSC